MLISDWSSDVCSSDRDGCRPWPLVEDHEAEQGGEDEAAIADRHELRGRGELKAADVAVLAQDGDRAHREQGKRLAERQRPPERSEEHTSELQSLMRTSYAVFCLKTEKITKKYTHN